MYFDGELEIEMRSPIHPERMLWSFAKNSDRESYVEKIVAEQMFKTYDHTMSPLCITRGKCDCVFCVKNTTFRVAQQCRGH